FLQKLALALAAGIVLPALAWGGFDPAQPVTDNGKSALIIAYALIPCALKVLAIAALTLVPQEKEAQP
ncbi:MAG: MFS transporter, partial [Pseudomonadota bacterium]